MRQFANAVQIHYISLPFEFFGSGTLWSERTKYTIPLPSLPQWHNTDFISAEPISLSNVFSCSLEIVPTLAYPLMANKLNIWKLRI